DKAAGRIGQKSAMVVGNRIGQNPTAATPTTSTPDAASPYPAYAVPTIHVRPNAGVQPRWG
ncbi:MAG: hypothetical protein ACLFRH_09045, partial [Halothiobacillaceae bacterium]